MGKNIDTKDVVFLEIDVQPRYLEDADFLINEKWVREQILKGQEPKMPFMVRVGDEKFFEYHWKITIDLRNAKILNWPKGLQCRVYYKVCDEGIYYLLDKNKNVLKKLEDYVPSILSYNENGYGDYIILKIDDLGNIINFPKENINYYIQKIIDSEGF